MESASQPGWAFRSRPYSDPNSTDAASPPDLINAAGHGLVFRSAVLQKRNVKLAVNVPWDQARAFVEGERLRNNVGFIRYHVAKNGPGSFWDRGLSATFRRGNHPFRVHEYASSLKRSVIFLFSLFTMILFRFLSLLKLTNYLSF